jgi:hypothetical protein
MILAAVLVLGTIGFFFLRPRDPISHRNFGRLQVGMTEKEVEAILGGAPQEIEDVIGSERPLVQKNWYGHRTAIEIVFDDGKLVGKRKTYFWDSRSLWEQWLEFFGLKKADGRGFSAA